MTIMRPHILRYLLNVSVPLEEMPEHLEFNSDGTVKSAQLKIMNLRRGTSGERWEEVRVTDCGRVSIAEIAKFPGDIPR